MMSGALDRRITVERLTTSQDATGEPVETWSDAGRLFAQRDPKGAIERFSADQRYAVCNAVFQIRWFSLASQITPQSYRISYRGRTYEILGVEEIGREEGFNLVCVARGDLGGSA